MNGAAVTALSLLPAMVGLAAAGQPGAFLEVQVVNRFAETPEAQRMLITTRAPCSVAAVLYDLHDQPVAVRVGTTESNGVDHEVDLDGLPGVDEGLHLFALVARDGDGSLIGVYPEVPPTFAFRPPEEVRINRRDRRLEYTLARAGSAMFRLGLDNGICLDTVGSYRPRRAGRHSVPWDGSAAGGFFRDLHNHPDLMLAAVSCLSPANLLVAPEAGKAVPGTAISSMPADLGALERPPWTWEDNRVPGDTFVQFRAQQEFQIETAWYSDPGGNGMELEVTVAEEDRCRLFASRFEVTVFVDGVFQFEEEHGVLPARFQIPRDELPPGRHLVTVNVVNVRGVVGIAHCHLDVPALP